LKFVDFGGKRNNSENKRKEKTKEADGIIVRKRFKKHKTGAVTKERRACSG